MYRLTNLTMDKTTTYKHKDLVYQALERENAKVKHQEAEGVLLIEELDKKGVVVFQEDVYLPFEGIADSLFLQKSTPAPQPKPKRGFSKNSSDDVKDQSNTLREEQALREPISDTTNQSDMSLSSSLLVTFKKIISIFIILISLGLSGVAITLAIHQTQNVHQLTNQVSQMKQIQRETLKLDVFMRYFLPNYYSEKGQLEPFLSPNLMLKPQSGQLQSVILEAVTSEAKNTYQLTYVLAIKNSDHPSKERCVVTVKADTSARYGYQVIKAPKQLSYPEGGH